MIIPLRFSDSTCILLKSLLNSTCEASGTLHVDMNKRLLSVADNVQIGQMDCVPIPNGLFVFHTHPNRMEGVSLEEAFIDFPSENDVYTFLCDPTCLAHYVITHSGVYRMAMPDSSKPNDSEEIDNIASGFCALLDRVRTMIVDKKMQISKVRTEYLLGARRLGVHIHHFRKIEEIREDISICLTSNPSKKLKHRRNSISNQDESNCRNLK